MLDGHTAPTAVGRDLASSKEAGSAKDGNSTAIAKKVTSEMFTAVGLARNVTGAISILEDPLLTKVKRCAARGLATTGTVLAGLGYYNGSLSTLVGFGACIAGWLLHEPVREYTVDVIREVIDGNLIAHEGKTSEEKGSAGENSRTGESIVHVPRKLRRQNWMGSNLKKRNRARIPVLAGEIRGTLKLKHGIIKNSPVNRLVIQNDASHIVRARRQEGDPMFVNMRDNDLYEVSLHAAQMYWIPSTVELHAMEMYSEKPVAMAREVQSSWVDDPSDC